MRYTIVRQRRRTIGLYVGKDGELEVRAPRACSLSDIEACVRRHEDWIARRRSSALSAQEARALPPSSLPLLGRELPVRPGRDVRLADEGDAFFAPEGMTFQEMLPALAALYRQLAWRYLPARVEEWAARFGLCPQSVRVTAAAARWGSCSSKGTLCFSWRLMLASPAAVDSVVIHELMHLLELNHSPRFRRLERENTPEYEACRRELENLAGRLAREGWL